jgi:hypothetical protein
LRRDQSCGDIQTVEFRKHALGQASRKPFHLYFGYQRRYGCKKGSSQLFELARVFVRLDHVASRIVNADHSIM